MKMRRLSALCTLLSALPFLAPSAGWGSSGTEGASFLNIPVGARPAAMGSGYSALADDAYAPTWNPAGLGFLEDTEIAGQHLAYIDSVHYEYLSAVHPLVRGRALGFSMQYLGSGDIAGTDANGNSTGDFSTHYGAYTLAYGQRIFDQLSLGASAKWINAKIDDVSANAYAFDFGALYHANERLSLASTLTNAGTSLKFLSTGDSLPLAWHIAAAYEFTKQVLAQTEVVYDKTGLASGHFGAEWRPIEAVALRVGYRTDTLKQLSPLAGFTTGIGLNFMGQEFSYAWLPYGDLGDTQYFSLVLRFGQAGEKKRNLIHFHHRKDENLVDRSPEHELAKMIDEQSATKDDSDPGLFMKNIETEMTRRVAGGDSSKK